MASPWGRRLRPLAIVSALLFVLWGVASGGGLAGQIMDLNDVGWPDENAPGEYATWLALYLSAAASGCWVVLWGLLGLAWRPPLHFGALALLVAVGLEVAANLVIADFYGSSFGDQLEWYGDRVTFQTDGLVVHETRAFFIALPFVTAPLPFLVYLVALFSGAGRKRRAAPGHPAPGYPAPGYPAPGYPAPGYPAPAYGYGPPQPAAPYPQAQPVHPPPPAQQPAAPRVPWQQVPPVVPPARPARARPAPPDQQDTLPYRNPAGDS